MNELSIVILNYNTWEETIVEVERCHNVLSVPYKDIIVVDNASTNESAEKLTEYSKGKSIVFIISEENKGYASGNNIGLRYAFDKGYKYAFIMNNDIEFSDDTLAYNMIEVMKKDSTIAVINSDILSPDGYMFNRDSKRPSFWDYTLGILSYRKKGRQINNLGGYGYVYRPQGCCMLVDLMKIHEVDYMDENTFLYVEEPILAERLLKKNYRCACYIEQQVVHNHSVTVKSTFQKKKIRRMNNESFRYYLTEYRGFGKLKTTICCIVNSLKMIFLER
ncbi:MAG: glycosyltransferase family 2 protein [Lachnospiraceae bacterium]|nr:glycosyltransferase family 2 protein [Lachnospiraceae bacterium]